MRIVAAFAALAVEQLAADIGVHRRVGVLIDQLVETATAAAVTQTLPFGARHFRHRLAAPEGELWVGHRGNPQWPL